MRSLASFFQRSGPRGFLIRLHSSEATFESGSSSISFRTGWLAAQADGSVLATSKTSGGDNCTTVLATVVGGRSTHHLGPRENNQFEVNYRERAWAGGRIPSSRTRRELGFTEMEILTSRAIDRSLRPLIPADWCEDTEVVATLHSTEPDSDPVVLAINAASCALAMSGLPSHGPCGAVRVARVGSEFVVNPTRSMLAEAELDLLFVGTMDSVLMVEAAAGPSGPLPSHLLQEALEFAQNQMASVIKAQQELVEGGTQGEPRPTSLSSPSELAELLEAAELLVGADFEAVYRESEHTKKSRKAALTEVRDNARRLLNFQAKNRAELAWLVNKVEASAMRRCIMGSDSATEGSDGSRCDGRQIDEVRPLRAEVSVMPGLHGSSVFSRGNTQVLAVLTHGTEQNAIELESVWRPITRSQAIFQYQFPAFATGTTSRRGGAPDRRELGHAALMHRALTPVLPPPGGSFPGENAYRVAAEVLGSDGSSSMAAVCAASLCLMDAGVPITEHVAGIAMGLVSTQTRHVVLSDILGLEDGMGDMDLKIAGTRTGVTAVQLDVKVQGGLPLALVQEAIRLSATPLNHVLDTMEATLPTARSLDSPELAHLPRSERVEVAGHQMGKVIGTGGATINAMQLLTGARLDTSDKKANPRFVTISGSSTAVEAAKAELAKLLAESDGATTAAAIGERVQGTVQSILDFGVVVKTTDGLEGLCHVSELAWEHIKTPSDLLKVGDSIAVEILSKDVRGKMKFSRKACIEKPAGYIAPKPAPARRR